MYLVVDSGELRMEGRFLYFEKFRLDVRSGELVKEGRPVRLPPQPTKLLLLLVRSPGALVSHEEIQKQLWGEGVDSGGS